MTCVSYLKNIIQSFWWKTHSLNDSIIDIGNQFLVCLINFIWHVVQKFTNYIRWILKNCDKTYTCLKKNHKNKASGNDKIIFFLYFNFTLSYQIILNLSGRRKHVLNIMVCLQLFLRSKRTWLFSKPVRTWNMKHMAKLGLVLFSYINIIPLFSIQKMWWVSTNRFENFDRLIVKDFSERFICVIDRKQYVNLHPIKTIQVL